MNNLYQMELMVMLSDLDAFLEKLFTDTGFYESDNFTKKNLKDQLIKDYREICFSRHES